MTREERLKEVLEYRISRAQNEPIDDMDWFIENTIKDVLEAVNPPSSNLDKAARKAALVPELVGVDEEHLDEYPYSPIAEQKFKEGAKWDREQMMKEAVEADVNIYRDLTAGKSWAEFVVEMPTNNLGDKVRIIIVKED